MSAQQTENYLTRRERVPYLRLIKGGKADDNDQALVAPRFVDNDTDPDTVDGYLYEEASKFFGGKTVILLSVDNADYSFDVVDMNNGSIQTLRNPTTMLIRCALDSDPASIRMDLIHHQSIGGEMHKDTMGISNEALCAFGAIAIAKSENRPDMHKRYSNLFSATDIFRS